MANYYVGQADALINGGEAFRRLESVAQPLETDEVLKNRLKNAKRKKKKALRDLGKLEEYVDLENKFKRSEEEDHVTEKDSWVVNLTSRVVELERLLESKKKKNVEGMDVLQSENAYLGNHVTNLLSQVSSLYDDNDQLREDRRWCSKSVANHAFETLRVSHEYLESLGDVQMCGMDVLRHEGVTMG